MTAVSAVSVVTIAWRNETFARSFAASLTRAAEAAGGPAPELVVAVNGPGGEAAAQAIVEECAGTSLVPELVQLDTNTGFSGGANAGLAQSRGDVLVVANLDLAFDERFLKVLHREAQEREWDFLAPRVVQGDDAKEAGVGRRKASHRLGWVTPPPHCAEAVPAGNGSCLVFRRATLDRRISTFGELFDSEYHSFNEDIDLFWWADTVGLVVRYVPDLRVIHAQAGSFGGVYRFRARPPDVQRRVMANYRVTVWKNANGPREWLGWPLGEAVYLGQAVVSRGLKGAGLYVASWADAREVVSAIRRRRGSLRRPAIASGGQRRSLLRAGP